MHSITLTPILPTLSGVYGTYDFEAVPQHGIDPKKAVMVRWNAAEASFEAVSQAGGGELIER